MIHRFCFAGIALSLFVAGCAVQTGGAEPGGADPGSNAAPEGSKVEALRAAGKQVTAFTSQAEKDAALQPTSADRVRTEMPKECHVVDELDFWIETGIWSTYGGMICE